MPPAQQPISPDDYHRYVDLAEKGDGELHVSVERMFRYPIVSDIAIGDIRSAFSDSVRWYEPQFDFVIGLPTRGPELAALLAKGHCGFSRLYRGTKYRKGRSDIDYITIRYERSEGETGYLQMRRDTLTDPSGESFQRKRVLLADVELANGFKALGAREALRALQREVPGLHIDLIGYVAIVEFRGLWDGKNYNGREVLEREGIKVMSLVIFEDGKFKPTWTKKDESMGEAGGGEVVVVTKKTYPSQGIHQAEIHDTQNTVQ